jgi:hypothetical protein
MLAAATAVSSVLANDVRAEDLRPQIQSPGSVARPVGLGTPFRNGVLTDGRRKLLMASMSAWSGAAWSGGVYTTASGETIHFYVSDSYQPNRADNQRWIDYLGWLYHSDELSRLTVYMVRPFELPSFCGATATACYAPALQAMVVPGESSGGWSTDQIVAHEYGHHLANNRINPPWDALSRGTKRWSSYADICLQAQNGTALPGPSGGTHGFTAAEAFAEAFRVTNELRVASSATWPIIDSTFYPNSVAREMIRLDAVKPWTGVSTATTSRFTSYGRRVQAFVSRGPMDGTMTVSLTTRSGPKYELQLVDKSTGEVIEQVRTVRGRATFTVTLCGQRSLVVRIRRNNSRTGTFSVVVTQ